VPEGKIDARLARRRFDRAASSYTAAARLETEIAARMLERLDYIKLAPARVLDAGCGPPQRHLGRRYPRAQVIALDLSLAMLLQWRGRLFERRAPQRVCASLTGLPLAAGSVQLAWSNMALHWVDDPPAALRELHRVLAVEGLLMFSTLGPDTLTELRAAAGADRVHPFADMHDIGDQLLAAGFSEPVMDMERITIAYPDGETLLADLKASGQTHAWRPAAQQAQGLRGPRFRAALEAALNAQSREGKLAVTFEVLYGHAWKPEPRQVPDGRAIVRFAKRP
jgi:malonyl-CoA O-methyltransferase